MSHLPLDPLESDFMQNSETKDIDNECLTGDNEDPKTFWYMLANAKKAKNTKENNEAIDKK
jgi:hypothetical protein